MLSEGEKGGRPTLADGIRGAELAGQILAPGVHIDDWWGGVEAFHDERVGWEAEGILHGSFLTDEGFRCAAHPSD